jgi:RNA polymerase sigma factor (sigma-70 family)
MDDAPPVEPNVPPGRAVDWAAALHRHGRWLRRVILTRVGERQAVDEVMQEVSLAAVSSPAPIADGTAVAAWLYRVTVRQTLLYRRRSGRRRKLIDAVARRGARPADGPNESDPLRWLLSAERADIIRLAIARLPRRDADVLVLKYTEQWSYRELATHLGTTESAVEARLHRARARLRVELRRLHLTEDTP